MRHYYEEQWRSDNWQVGKLAPDAFVYTPIDGEAHVLLVDKDNNPILLTIPKRGSYIQTNDTLEVDYYSCPQTVCSQPKQLESSLPTPCFNQAHFVSWSYDGEC